MGYERKPLLLEFDEEQYEGLEIYSRRLSVGALLAIGDLVGTNWRTDRATGVAAFDDLAVELGKVLTSWNLEESVRDEAGELTGAKQDVPLDVEHIAAQDFEFVLDIGKSLMRGTAGAPRPLPRPSSDGDTSVEQSIPMEPLSESPASTSEPEPS